MKRPLFILTFLLSISNIYAQEINEPDFIGECILVKEDGSANQLEKSIFTTRSAGNASLFLFGLGSYDEKIQIQGCCSNTIFTTDENVKLIVKVADNNSDPLTVIRIIKLKNNKKKRTAELSSINSFGTKNTNKLTYMPFVGKKYGKSSYVLEFKDLTNGEYGIIVADPNALNQRQILISTFAAI